MKKSIIAILLVGCSTVTAAASAIAEYKITIERSRPGTISVSARIDPEQGVVSMAEYGADQFENGWAHFVRDLTATDARGRKVELERLPGSKWRVMATGAVTMRYEVAVEHEKHTWNGGIDGVAFARNGGIFATGRSFLITGDRGAKDISITFDLKDVQRVTASWKPVDASRTRYLARNITDLEQSMFFAGSHDEFSVKRDGFELVFAVAGNGLSSRAGEFRKLATGVLDHYIKLMGGIPKPPPSNRFERSIAIINAGKDLDGEVIGNHISMILDPDGDAQTKLFGKFIFAHEFFHLWNGKSINVAETTEDWFKEGVTSYYTLKALHALGEISEAEFLGVLNNFFYKRYVSDPGFGKFSMRDVAAPGKKDKHWGLIYAGGMFAGICQDVAIRRATGNEKSLDDIMRSLFARLGGTTNTYTTADLENQIGKLAGRDQAEFFARYVYGTEAVPISQCLQEAGFKASSDSGDLSVSRITRVDATKTEFTADILGKK